MIEFLFLIFGFVFMEFFSYFVHRFLFHGPLWFIHRSHHEKRLHLLEWNDLFSFGFSLVAISLTSWAYQNLQWSFFAFCFGINLYGLLYFVAHDQHIHRRFGLGLPRLKFALLDRIKSAHQQHHASNQKLGQGPFGLFWL